VTAVAASFNVIMGGTIELSQREKNGSQEELKVVASKSAARSDHECVCEVTPNIKPHRTTVHTIN